MNTKRSSLHFAALLGSLALVGGVVAIDASGAAPQPTATCAGGKTTITFTGNAREGVQMDWADAERINISHIELAPAPNIRSISQTTPAGARFVAVFVGYNSKGTAHGGNVNLLVPCT